MKKFSTLTLLFLILVSPLYASHLMGGEITWKCNGNGTYTFTVKIYRDCNGVPAPAALNLISDGPVNTIPCIKISQIDLSPVGIGCPTCASPNLQSSAVEENIYESDTITLSGVPPSIGWNFWYSDCCRNGNIVNLSSSDFTLKAKMYSFSGLNASPCYDNSPYFADSPSLSACNKDTIQFNHTAFDVELDSLAFSWTPPLSTNINTNAVFNSPYTYQNPLPGPAQNPQNTVATLDSSQGIISFYSNSIGSYVTANKVSAFKCGQLVSEIYREVQVYLINCPIPQFQPLTYNKAPNVDQLAATNNSIFNVIAGDTFLYEFIAYDFDPQPTSPGGGQTITLNAIGFQLGLGDTSFTTGCIIPPCAVLQNPTPISVPASLQNKLTWPTTCAHAGFSNGCIQSQRTFQFILKVEDNFCPAHGVRYKNILVNVLGPQIYSSGNDLAVSYPGVTLQWYLNGVPIPGATDTIYTPTVAGIYSVMATTGSGCIMLSNSVNKTFTGIETLKSKVSSIQVFPNPSTGNATLNVLLNNIPTGSNLIRVIDVNGKVVKQIPIVVFTTDEHLLIDLSDCAKGVYSINLSGEGKIYQAQLVLTD